jgi:hypothetical protein
MQSELGATLESMALQRAATADEMAKALTPVAESMARLTEETRQTLERIVSQSQRGHAEAVSAVRASSQVAGNAASDLRSAMLRVQDQVRELTEAAKEARETPPVNPWGPAIVAALLPTLAVLWLGWKCGLLHL